MTLLVTLAALLPIAAHAQSSVMPSPQTGNAKQGRAMLSVHGPTDPKGHARWLQQQACEYVREQIQQELNLEAAGAGNPKTMPMLRGVERDRCDPGYGMGDSSTRSSMPPNRPIQHAQIINMHDMECARGVECSPSTYAKILEATERRWKLTPIEIQRVCASNNTIMTLTECVMQETAASKVHFTSTPWLQRADEKY